MSTITSNGKEYVYAVMSADGYECESLEAIFATEQEASAYVAAVQSRGTIQGRILGRQWKESDCYGNPDLLTVECLELGKKRRPDPPVVAPAAREEPTK